MRDTVRHVLRPIWNTWYFLTLYANAAETTGTFRTDQTDVLDRYLLGELRTLVRSITATMDDYDLFGACQNVVDFVDTLSNWYIRRSRDRFWAGDQDAIDTLHTALVTLCRVAAPVLPLLTEHIYVGLTGERSVHLTDWPDAEQFPHDDDLTTGMGLVRDACSTLLSLRKSEGLRVRLPLAKATVATPTTELMRPHLDILRDELNVKEIELTDDVQSVGRTELSLNPAASARGSATRRSRSSRPTRPATGPSTATASWSAASSCSPTSTRSGWCRRPTARRRRSRATTGSWCSTPRSPPSSRPKASRAI